MRHSNALGPGAGGKGTLASSRKRGLATLEKLDKQFGTRNTASKQALEDRPGPESGVGVDKESGNSSAADGLYAPSRSLRLSPALAAQLHIDLKAGSGGTELEEFLLQVFRTSTRSGDHDGAIANKLHDKTLALGDQDKKRNVSASVAMSEAKGKRRKVSGTLLPRRSSDELNTPHEHVVSTLRHEIASGDLEFAGAQAALNPAWNGYAVRLCAGRAQEAAVQELLKAQLVGARIEVVACMNPGSVGRKGVVIWANKVWIHLLTECSRFVSLLRRHSIVALYVPRELQQLVGPSVVLERGAV